MAYQYDNNVLPDSTGRDLGSTTQRWDLFAQNLDISGTSDLAGFFNDVYIVNDNTSGSDFGAKVNTALAALPSTGGVIDARAINGTQTVSTLITVNKPCVLLMGAGTFTFSSGVYFSISKQFQVYGLGRGVTTLSGPQSTHKLFTWTAGVSLATHFVLKSMTLTGGGGAYQNQCIYVPSSTGNQGLWRIDDCYIGNYGNGSGSQAVYFGDSNYRIDIADTVFNFNRDGDIYVGYASDGKVENCNFWNLSLVKPHATVVGGGDFRFIGCEYENNNSSSQPDILLDAASASNNGEVWIQDCKFGPESEIAGRYKIQALSSVSATYPIKNVKIIGNRFSGLDGSTPITAMIRLDNPPANWKICQNEFYYATTVVDDAFSLQTANVYGNSIFSDNSVVAAVNAPSTLFSNGGRGFSVIETPRGTDSKVVDDLVNHIPRPTETIELRNRATYSEDFNSWTKNSGATVTSTQTDPYGTTRACLINHGGVSGCNIGLALNSTGLKNRIVLDFWAKANTLSSATVVLTDGTSGTAGEYVAPVKLGTSWKQCRLTFPIYDTSHSFSVNIYPGGQTNTSAGSFYLFGFQASDYGSDYLSTSGAAASDTSAGTRIEKNLRLGTAATISEYKGLTTAGLGLTPIVATVALTAQAASIGSTNLLANAPAGQYRVHVSQQVTQAATTSSSIQTTIGWNNGSAKTTSTAADTTNVANAEIGGDFVIHVASTSNITYSTTYASTGGTVMQYAIYITLERLQ